MSTTTSNLADLVYGVMSCEDDSVNNTAHGAVNWQGTDQLDCIDWGVVFGMCFAILRERDPWATHGQLAAEALPAAIAVMERWGGQEWGPGAARVEAAA